MIACDCEVWVDRLTSSTNTAARRCGVNLSGPLRGFGAAREHLDHGVLFQALEAGGEPCQNYLAVSVVLFLNSMHNYQREDKHGKLTGPE